MPLGRYIMGGHKNLSYRLRYLGYVCNVPLFPHFHHELVGVKSAVFCSLQKIFVDLRQLVVVHYGFGVSHRENRLNAGRASGNHGKRACRRNSRKRRIPDFYPFFIIYRTFVVREHTPFLCKLHGFFSRFIPDKLHYFLAQLDCFRRSI